MRLIRKHTATLGIWLAALLIASQVLALPESIFSAPGEEIATEKSFWLAPFTLCTMRSIGRERGMKVQWFSAAGKLVEELQDVFFSESYVELSNSAGTTYVSILNPSWKVVVLKSTEKSVGYQLLDVTSDGRTMVFSSQNSVSRDKSWHVPTTIDIYTEGKRATLGPYIGALYAHHLDESGALAFALPHGEVIVADRKGRVQFHETVGTWDGIISCTDRALLVRHADQIQYIGFDGNRSSLSIPRFQQAQWIGGSRWLFGIDSDSILVADCEAGRTLWRNGYGNTRIVERTQAFAVAGTFLLAAAIVSERRPGWPSVMLRAFDLDSGNLSATWDGYADPSPNHRLQFFTLDGKVLFLDGTRVSAIDPGKIHDGKDGWKLTQSNR